MRVLALSAYDDEQYVFGLLDAGAAGYLLKDEAVKAIVVAVRGDRVERDPRTLLPAGIQFILAAVTCSFRSPATLRDRLVVAIWVSPVGRKSFVFEYRITDEVTGRLVAEGCSTQVWYDYAAGENRVVPGEVVEGMERLQEMTIPRT